MTVARFRSLLFAPVLALLLGACGGGGGSAAGPDGAGTAADGRAGDGSGGGRDAVRDAPAELGAPLDGSPGDVPPTGRDAGRDGPAESDGDAPDGAAGGDAGDGADGAPPCPAECCADGDCDDRNACTIDRCVDGACTHRFDLCDDDDECTLDSCNVQTGCRHQEIADCCPLTWVWRQGFETGDLAGFGVTDLAQNTHPAADPLDAPIVWSPSTRRARSGGWSLYGGDPDTLTYDNGRWVAARAVSPPLVLDASLPSRLVFWSYLGVESGPDVDTLNVGLLVDGADDAFVPLWRKTDRTPLRDWARTSLDLTAFRGRTVRIVFQFDTIDGLYNAHEGVYLDDVAVGTECAPRTCTAAAACDDGVACTADACGAEGACAGTWAAGCCGNLADCRDGDACTLDLCEAGACRNVPDPRGGCCDTTAECDDGDPCTRDECWDHRCRRPPSDAPGCCVTDAECDLGDPCWVGVCGADGACGAEPVCCFTAADCADPADRCVVGACLPSGECHVGPSGWPGCCAREAFVADFAAGGLDGFFLSNSTTTVGWQLGGGPGTLSPEPALYYGDPDSHTYDSGTRNSGTARTRPIALPAAAESWLEFRLLLGVEAGPAHDTLRVVLRVRDTAFTVFEKTTGTPVDLWIDVRRDLSGFAGETVELEWQFDTRDAEGNDREGVYVAAVAVRSTCQAKACADEAGCEDGFGATVARCDALSTCQFTLHPDVCETDAACDDADVCTADRCVAGACVAEAIDGCCHDAGECDDGDPCTTDECRPGPPPGCRHTPRAGCCSTAADCDDGNRCTADACPGPGGACGHEWRADCCLSNLDCADGDDCTADRCIAGECANVAVCCGEDEDCDDGDDLCTADACDPNGRCRFEPTGAPDCCRAELLTTGWDGLDPAGFTFENAQAAAGWALVEGGPAPEGDGVAAPWLYFGDPQDQASYGSLEAGANEGTALSGWLALPPGVAVTLSFDYWLNAEGDFDAFSVVLDFNGRLATLYRDDDPLAAWRRVALDLSFAAGHTVRVGFRFEADANTFHGDPAVPWQGAFVDHVALRSTCAPAACAVAADCATVPCVTARCEAQRCVWAVPVACCEQAADCDDGDVCTEDRCEDHACTFPATGALGCCMDDADCDDGDPCTTDTCGANRCRQAFVVGCTPVAPRCEDFEGAYGLSAFGFTTAVSPGGQPGGWDVGPYGVASFQSTQLVFHGLGGLADPFEQCALTPVLDGGALGAAATLRFRQHLEPGATPGAVTLSARSSASGGQFWTTVWSYEVGATTAPLEEVTATLPAGTAGSSAVQVALCVSGHAGLGLGAWHVDDLCVLAGGAPVLGPLGDVTLDVGTLLALPVAATDPDGDVPALSLQAGPPFVLLTDHGDGTGTLDVAPGIADRGEYDVVLRADDGTFAAEAAFHLSVRLPGEVVVFAADFGAADPPGGLAALGWEEWLGAAPGETNWHLTDESGGGFPGVVRARFEDTPVATDFDHRLVSPVFDASTIAQATVAWEDSFDQVAGGGPLLLAVLASADGGAGWTELWRYEAHVQGDFAATAHSVSDTAVLGGAAQARLAFQVRGEDSYDVSWWELARVTVSGIDAGAAPVWEPVPDLGAGVGERLAVPLSAADPDSAELTFLPGGDVPRFVSIVNDGPQTATLLVAPGIGDEGAYAFQLRVTDGWHPVPQPVTLTVAVTGLPPLVDPIPPQTAVAGEVWKVDLRATDPDGLPVTWHADAPWPPFAALRDHGGGAATLTLRPTLADAGDHPIPLRVDDTTQYVAVSVPVTVVYPGGAPLFGEDFEGPATLAERGWTTDGDPASAANDWSLVPPDPLLGGTRRARFADFPAVADFRDRLLSPPIDTTAAAAVTVRCHTLFASYPPADADPPVTLALLASTNGGASWQPLWTHAETAGDLPWSPVEVGPTAALAGVPDLRLAFEIAGADSATILFWDVDDVTVGGAAP